MELDPKFTFVHLENVNLPNIYDKQTEEYLEKWGLKTGLNIQQYVFNEPFQMYNKHHLIQSFFQDSIVTGTLKTKKDDLWITEGIKASNVDIKYVPCSITKMSFFDKLKNPDNNIVYSSGSICNTYHEEIDGFIVANKLQAALLNQESDEYFLYELIEKEEFMYRIFQLLVLGGRLCQYEDILQPYLDITKKFYKDLIGVHKKDDKLCINTMVFDVVAKNANGQSYFPSNPDYIQNIAFICINPYTHLITTLLHQYI